VSCDYCVDSGNNRLSLATPIPPQISRETRHRELPWSRISGGERSGALNMHAEGGAVMSQIRGFPADWKSIEWRVPITRTHCHLAGRRPWFVRSAWVNGQYCGERVAVLYAAGELFACRSCCGLAYASQREHQMFRDMYRKSECGSAAVQSRLLRSQRGHAACGGAHMSVIAKRWCASKATCSPDKMSG